MKSEWGWVWYDNARISVYKRLVFMHERMCCYLSYHFMKCEHGFFFRLVSTLVRFRLSFNKNGHSNCYFNFICCSLWTKNKLCFKWHELLRISPTFPFCYAFNFIPGYLADYFVIIFFYSRSIMNINILLRLHIFFNVVADPHKVWLLECS